MLHNHGDGTFEPWQTLSLPEEPIWMVAEDFNGDGWPDVAVMYNRAAGRPSAINQPYLTVHMNDGTGHLSQRNDYIDPNLNTGGFICAGDFDGDGRPDLVFPEESTKSVLVMLNRGNGTIGRPVPYGAASQFDGEPMVPMAGDLNGDGRTDLLVLAELNYLVFLPNLSCGRCYANCDGSTTPPVLNVQDFACFVRRFAAGDPWANCDQSTRAPVLNANDFLCFLNKFAAGCP